MILRTAALAAAIALVPAIAPAATITGNFTEGGTTNLIDGFGRQGSFAISDAADGGTFSFVFELENTSDVLVLGNVRQIDSVIGFSATVDGLPVNVTADTGNQQTFDFNFSGNAGDTFEIVVGFDSANPFDVIDVGIETSPVPVPASGLLLAGVLAGAGFAARRKAKKA